MSLELWIAVLSLTLAAGSLVAVFVQKRRPIAIIMVLCLFSVAGVVVHARQQSAVTTAKRQILGHVAATPMSFEQLYSGMDYLEYSTLEQALDELVASGEVKSRHVNAFSDYGAAFPVRVYATDFSAFLGDSLQAQGAGELLSCQLSGPEVILRVRMVETPKPDHQWTLSGVPVLQIEEPYTMKGAAWIDGGWIDNDKHHAIFRVPSSLAGKKLRIVPQVRVADIGSPTRWAEQRSSMFFAATDGPSLHVVFHIAEGKMEPQRW